VRAAVRIGYLALSFQRGSYLSSSHQLIKEPTYVKSP
jgi:hypothetical protein